MRKMSSARKWWMDAHSNNSVARRQFQENIAAPGRLVALRADRLDPHCHGSADDVRRKLEFLGPKNRLEFSSRVERSADRAVGLRLEGDVSGMYPARIDDIWSRGIPCGCRTAVPFKWQMQSIGALLLPPPPPPPAPKRHSN